MLPFSYSVLLHRTVYCFCLILPFSLESSLGIWTPVIVSLIAYLFLGLDALRDLAADGLTVSGAQTYIDTMDTAISTLSGWQSDFGSTQNSLESRIRNMTTTVTNLNAARDQIMNLDFEQESSNFSKLQIQAQSGLFALSQANVIQQNVLRLLQ